MVEVRVGGGWESGWFDVGEGGGRMGQKGGRRW